jgi:hypothetical protein
MEFYFLNIAGLIINSSGALTMLCNMPRGKDVDRRIRMRRRVKIGVAIVLAGVILQVVAIYHLPSL